MRRRAARRPALIAPVVLALAAGLAACGGDDTTSGGASDADLTLGERVYADNCATCHGDQGEGGVGPQLGDGAVVDHYPDVEDHRAVVVNGLGQMPAWGGRLTDEEIDAVVAYERERLGNNGS